MTEQAALTYDIRRITVTRKDAEGNVLEVIVLGEEDASDERGRNESRDAA